MGNENSKIDSGSSTETPKVERRRVRSPIIPQKKSPDFSPSGARSKSAERLTADKVDSTLLSTHQKSLMKQNWKNLQKENLGPQILSKILALSPEIKKIYEVAAAERNLRNCATLHQKHGVVFVELLDFAVKYLDNCSAIEKKCYEFGAEHVQLRCMGLKPVHFDVFGEAAAESVRSLMRQRPNRELLHAWTLLCCFMIDKIRQGYTTTIRRRRSADMTLRRNDTQAPAVIMARRPSSSMARPRLLVPTENYF